MITNLIEKNRVKADPYWPAHLAKTEKYGDMFVKLAEETQQSAGVFSFYFLSFTYFIYFGQIVKRKFRLWKAPPVRERRDSQR